MWICSTKPGSHYDFYRFQYIMWLWCDDDDLSRPYSTFRYDMTHENKAYEKNKTTMCSPQSSNPFFIFRPTGNSIFVSPHFLHFYYSYNVTQWTVKWIDRAAHYFFPKRLLWKSKKNNQMLPLRNSWLFSLLHPCSHVLPFCRNNRELHICLLIIPSSTVHICMYIDIIGTYALKVK